MTTESRVPLEVRERERKFDLDPDRPVPRLDGVGPIANQREPCRDVLDATYFDTEDRRLLRAGFTLRKRTGGADAGWHLKVPVSADTRDELHLPLGDDDAPVPPELTERAGVDAADLVEVAHIRTERQSYDLVNHAGQRLAVLTDDQVTAESAGTVAHLDGWREVEIELCPIADAGLLDTLGQAMARAGARPAHWPSKLRRLLAEELPDEAEVGKRSTAGEVVMAYLRTQVEALRRHDLGVRRNEDDAVHQLRVAMRRMRSALTTFRRVVDRERTATVVEELKWAGAALSEARDTEVLRDLFADEMAELGEDAGVATATATLTHHFDQAAANARAATLETLHDPRYAALLGSLEALIDEPALTADAERPARKELGRAIGRAQRRLAKAVNGLADAADGPAMDEALHRVRKKAKQARYAADAVRPAFGSRLKSWRASAKAIQTTLGDYHDLVEARALLERLRDTGTVSSQAAFALGRLYERSRTRGEALHEDFDKQWRQMGTPSV